jgi:hypothetical protein
MLLNAVLLFCCFAKVTFYCNAYQILLTSYSTVQIFSLGLRWTWPKKGWSPGAQWITLGRSRRGIRSCHWNKCCTSQKLVSWGLSWKICGWNFLNSFPIISLDWGPSFLVPRKNFIWIINRADICGVPDGVIWGPHAISCHRKWSGRWSAFHRLWPPWQISANLGDQMLALRALGNGRAPIKHPNRDGAEWCVPSSCYWWISQWVAEIKRVEDTRCNSRPPLAWEAFCITFDFRSWIWQTLLNG